MFTLAFEHNCPASVILRELAHTRSSKNFALSTCRRIRTVQLAAGTEWKPKQCASVTRCFGMTELFRNNSLERLEAFARGASLPS